MNELAKIVYASLLRDDDDIVYDSEEEARRMQAAEASQFQTYRQPHPAVSTPRPTAPQDQARGRREEFCALDRPRASNTPLEPLVSVGDVARLLAVHPGTVYRWIKAGVLRAFQPIAGGPWRIPGSAVQQFLAGRSAGGGAHE